MPTILPFPTHITLVPLRSYHVQHGQGRTVAVLFRVSVDQVRHPQGGDDQHHRDQHAAGGIGAKE